ncbi:hypothetical protein D1007_45999 [Hordeum vulgare]|nr:hypothetical protein D1007_45999 [Hordeum vulgare]
MVQSRRCNTASSHPPLALFPARCSRAGASSQRGAGAGAGENTMESGRVNQVAGGGSGVDRLDRCSNIRQAGQGDGSAPYLNRVSSDEARRRGNGNPDNGRETTWKGLVSNDIYYIWNHGPKFGGGFNCRYCSLISRGGGATRFREHLGGILGEVRECPNVPRNVCAAMRDSQDDARRKKREKKNCRLRLERDIMEGLYHGEGVINIEDGDEQIQTVLRESLRDKNVSRAVERRRGSGSGVRVSLGKQSITTYFDKELSSNKVSMQPKISTALNVESEDILSIERSSQSDGGDPAMQLEKDLPSQVGNDDEVSSDGSLVNRRSERVRQAKKVKEVTSLYN